ncbi:MAG: hypothetical protein K2Q18_18900 [Bdellovibrionales bacterium]|nr:hypothetical protein [Bdellovibrionales bacterium]
MRIISILMGLSFTFNTYALEVFPFGDTIELSSETCSETESIVKSLEDWTKIKCKKIEGCKYDIKSCLPAHIAGVVGKYSGYEGPNCWNLALVMKGILPGLRFSTKEEMAFYLNSPLCRNLEEGEERRPGDVGAIRELVNNKAYEFHGFIYISDKIAFAKNGETYESSYDLQTLNNVFASYQMSSKEECYGNRINLNSLCMNATSYFRCESLDAYLSKRAPISMDLKEIIQATSNYEKCNLEPFLVDGKVLSDKATNAFINTTKALVKYTENQIKKNQKLSDEEKFIVTSLDLRMRSISEQFKKAYKSEYAEKLNFK